MVEVMPKNRTPETVRESQLRHKGLGGGST